MKAFDRTFFHKLYGIQKPRVTYYERDFVDYALMILLSGLALVLSYGVDSPISIAGLVLCATVLATFTLRHGFELNVPLALRRPQDAVYMLIYKLQNLRPMYFVALGLLLLENLLIAATPDLPHHIELMRKIGLSLFYVHFLSITGFRTAIFIDHLAKREHVLSVLMQTPWKRVIHGDTNIALEIVHAYCTGLLTHVLLIAPWYLVIIYSKFSVIFLPVMCLIDVVIHLKWTKDINSWFYRDHWLGHNSELEFVFLHGSHHDAIPCGLIAVAGNGFLEGFLRFSIGSPVTFYNPAISFLVYMFDVKTDIELHQYIPGVFPRLPRRVFEVGQHSTHHYGQLEPYSFGLKLDQPTISIGYRKRFKWVPDELMNSLRLDEELTGFEWDNPTHRNTLRLWDKYQTRWDKVQARAVKQ